MKKLLLIFGTSLATCITTHAQTQLNKIPANASVVIKYAGENFSKQLPLKKLDSYQFIRQTLFKATSLDTLTSLDNLGVNFEQDTYQYVVTDDSTINFVTLFTLKNVDQFVQLLQANYHAEMKPEQKNGYQLVQLAPTMYVGWNKLQAILVASSYRNEESYYAWSRSVAVDSTTATVAGDDAVMVDTVIAIPPPPEPVERPMPKAKQGKGKKGNGGKGGSKNMAGKKKGAPVKKKPAEEIVEITEEESAYSYKMSAADSIEEVKRTAWYDARDKRAAARQRAASDSIINFSFNGTVASIAATASYQKLIEPAAHVSVWLDYDNLMQQYWSTLFRGIGAGFSRAMKQSHATNDPSFNSAMNIYFEKDQMRIGQKMWSPDQKLDDLGKKVYASKQSNQLVNYVNPGNLGYMSIAINTEAMASYYYTLIRKYMKSYPYVQEYSDMVDVYMDLIDIVVDEKAIAEVIPGNSIFVMHDMTTRDVTYTDYVYNDSDFTSKPVTKTKKELSPNFTFVMETKRDDFMQKLANLPVKYAERGKFNYKDKGGYYELAFDKNNMPISSLYFMVKDGKVIVTTNKASIDITMNNTAGTLDAATKASIMNNNFSMKLNSKKIIQQVSSELSTDASKKVANYMEANMGDITVEAGLQDGMVQGNTIMGITGSHANSLEFFFNMIDSINKIIEQDKQEKDKKVD